MSQCSLHISMLILLVSLHECMAAVILVNTIGTALSVRHFRNNTECGKIEELPPIDENLQYNFNYSVASP